MGKDDGQGRERDDRGAAAGPGEDEGEAGRVSRRRFLLGTGVTAAATMALEGCRPAEGPPRPPEVFGPGRVAFALRVNGELTRVEVEPRATLADVLRFELGLTGTKVACDRGACGACTVWLDGAAVCSCMTFAVDASERTVTTIEGLAQGDKLHPVQEAFIEHDAAQCGFCTPGMIMSCAALLRKTKAPTLEDVRAATSGNLCRCATYPKVFEATLAAAKGGA
jgi:aerobic-type carbon monoxide dehydrogenase small subunit (CoxS/CutS family)